MNNEPAARPHHPASRPPADLSHLHPDTVRIGSIAVFAGDWAWTGQPPRIPVGFVGTLIDYWNGWAVWRCTREVAEAVVADQQRLRDAERARLAELGTTDTDLDHAVDECAPPLWFDGDDLVLDETVLYGEPSVDRQSPGPDGRYCPMGFHWTWTVVDPADCDRIAGVLPARGEHREYVLATHQPLRMPHDRLAVTAVHRPGDGTASTAALFLDGQPAGTITHTRPGATVFQPAGPEFDHADLERFVSACRWRGRPVTTPEVLKALTAEYEITTRIATAAEGTMPVLLRDGDEHPVSTAYRADPARLAGRPAPDLAAELTAAAADQHPDLSQFVWQVWTGRRWRLIGIVDVPRDGTPAGAR